MDELKKAKEVLKETHECVDDLLFVSGITGKAEMRYTLIKDGYKVEIDIQSVDNGMDEKK